MKIEEIKKFFAEKYIYVVDPNILVSEASLAKKAGGLSVPSSKTVHLFKSTDKDSALRQAQTLATSNKAAIVYTCIDMQSKRLWSRYYDAGILGPMEGLQVIEAQPVLEGDNKNLIAGAESKLAHPAIEFVPRPTFLRPSSAKELQSNLNLYLLYRTGEQRGAITHQKRFGFFTSYSIDQEKSAIHKLLEAIDNPGVQFEEVEINILQNALLGTATLGFESLLPKRLTSSSSAVV